MMTYLAPNCKDDGFLLRSGWKEWGISVEIASAHMHIVKPPYPPPNEDGYLTLSNSYNAAKTLTSCRNCQSRQPLPSS